MFHLLRSRSFVCHARLEEYISNSELPTRKNPPRQPLDSSMEKETSTAVPDSGAVSAGAATSTAASNTTDTKSIFTKLFQENIANGMDANEAAAKALQTLATLPQTQNPTPPPVDVSRSSTVQASPRHGEVSGKGNGGGAQTTTSTYVASPTEGSGLTTSSKHIVPSSDPTCNPVSPSSCGVVNIKRPAEHVSPTRERKRQELLSPSEVQSLTLEDQQQKIDGANALVDLETFQAILADEKTLVRSLTAVFHQPESLNACFVDTSTVCTPQCHAVDFDILDAVFGAMMSHEEAKGAIMMGSFLRISEMELWVKRLTPSMKVWKDPWELRGLFIMAMNPLRSDPEYHDFFNRLYRVLDQVPEAGKLVLRTWYETLSPKHFKAFVDALQQYITCSFYMEESVEPNISSATKVLADLFTIYTKQLDEGSVSGRKKGDPSSSSLLSYDDFKNDAINEDFDLKKDFQNWFVARAQEATGRARGGAKPFSFCKYNFILDAAAKAYILRLDAMLEQSHMQRQTFIQRMTMSNNGQMGVRMEVLYLVLRVHRDRIVEDTLTAVDSKSSDELKKPLKIVFEGEEGIDEGGVQKEFFQVMLRELLDPNYGMFRYNEKLRQLWFNADTFESPVKFILFGTLLGLAIYNQVILDIHFPPVVFKRLVQKEAYVPTLNDLEALDPELHQSLEFLLACEDASVTASSFEIHRTSMFGELITTELKPNGASIDVTNDNRDEFVGLYLQHLLVDSIAVQFDAFCRGFRRVCDSQTFNFFRPEELELLISGSEKLDFHALERACVYEGYTKDHRIVKEFWETVHAMPEETQRRLLSFSTGSDRAPIKGLGSLKFVLARAGPDSEQLPTSHTCFNHLLIPEYSSVEKLKKLLYMAVAESEGFGLM
jgi:ubiquitin-protein ligase E3 A